MSVAKLWLPDSEGLEARNSGRLGLPCRSTGEPPRETGWWKAICLDEVATLIFSGVRGFELYEDFFISACTLWSLRSV